MLDFAQTFRKQLGDVYQKFLRFSAESVIQNFGKLMENF